MIDLEPEAAPAVPERRGLRRERWLGFAVGALAGGLDLAFTLLLGIHFEMNGSDVTIATLGLYGATFAALGYTFGLVLEGRRRDRAQAALIRRQLETIAAARARLVQSEKLAALGQLAAAIAHEVRNALAIIRSSAQGLGETLPEGDDESRRASAFILAEIDRLTSVVSSLLSFARPPRLAPRPVEVTQLFEQAALLVGEELAAKNVRLERRATGQLPPVQADPDLLVQVLLGLLSNAAAAVPPGGEIALEARPAGAVVELAVSDSGPGVPEELRGRIFEPFFTTRDRGTGLGLAVARQIVEAHAGRIEVGERPGGGARFRIELPAAARSAGKAAA